MGIWIVLLFPIEDAYQSARWMILCPAVHRAPQLLVHCNLQMVCMDSGLTSRLWMVCDRYAEGGTLWLRMMGSSDSAASESGTHLTSPAPSVVFSCTYSPSFVFALKHPNWVSRLSASPIDLLPNKHHNYFHRSGLSP